MNAQEADPKLDALREAIEHICWPSNEQMRSLTDEQWQTTKDAAFEAYATYIAGRERERWAPLLREAQAELDSHHRDGCSEVEAWNPRNQICSCGMEAWRTAVSALLQPEQGGQ